jgi:hypothetical protein
MIILYLCQKSCFNKRHIKYKSTCVNLQRPEEHFTVKWLEIWSRLNQAVHIETGVEEILHETRRDFV